MSYKTRTQGTSAQIGTKFRTGEGTPYSEPTLKISKTQRIIKDKEKKVFFPVDGRTAKEIKEMKEYFYDEFPLFKDKATKTGGRNCGNCGAFESKPNSMPINPSKYDGYCHKYKFRDRNYGCCDGWYLNNPGIYSYSYPTIPKVDT